MCAIPLEEKDSLTSAGSWKLCCSTWFVCCVSEEKGTQRWGLDIECGFYNFRHRTQWIERTSEESVCAPACTRRWFCMQRPSSFFPVEEAGSSIWDGLNSPGRLNIKINNFTALSLLLPCLPHNTPCSDRATLSSHKLNVFFFKNSMWVGICEGVKCAAGSITNITAPRKVEMI